MNNQERNPKGDVAVVTGACGGLGAALSRALVKEGVQVVGIARTISKVDALADELGALFTPVVADVGDATAIAQAFETIAADIGPVTILINNAAVYPRCDILAETPQSFMRSVEINLGGVFNCCHAVLPGMVERGAGRIINVSTYAHIAPLQAAAAYSVSKGAAHVFTKSLVADLSDRFPNIVINEWIPGELRTEMGVPDGIDPAVSASWGVRLALWQDPMLTGRLFDENVEIFPPMPLKRRILARLAGRKRNPLRLD